MNVLGVGGWELLVVLLVMMVVAGPKRMILWSGVLGATCGEVSADVV